ncbi:ORF6N domain-containing protein [Rhodoferax sp.]|uniref:ORF6N domain-containing protein n=1 Tax=Rhodoferax sp. TaxID=50421 RepID=UPI00374C9EA8
MQSKEDLSPAITKAAMSPHALSARILQIRGQRVLLDADLAELYEVATKRLNEQVKRNADRFPADFMFPLTPEEFTDLKSQFATSSWGGRRKLPFAFTEHGAIMAASVLNSRRAVETSVYVVRAFVQLRELLSSQKVLAEQVTKLERRVSHHDQSLTEIIDALRGLMERPSPTKRSIGFTAKWTDDKAPKSSNPTKKKNH